jgi:hypothetical protein
MKSRIVALAGALFLGTMVSAHAVEIQKKLEVPGNPESVWKIANEFCSIKTWHPAFSDCTQSMENGVVWRVLTLRDGGGKIREKLTDVDDYSYSYSIVEAPLPIKNHKGKFWVEKGEMPSRSMFHWNVSFDLKEGSETETETTTKAIDGILANGLENIKNIAAKSGDCK